MYKINLKNLKKLIDFLEDLEESKFNFAEVVSSQDENNCGTVCCAIGWTPAIFPDLVSWSNCPEWGGGLKLKGGPMRPQYSLIAEELFGMCFYEVAGDLFCPGSARQVHEDLPELGPNATPNEVADMLLQFIDLVRTEAIADHEIDEEEYAEVM